jgi:hypothetical protein
LWFAAPENVPVQQRAAVFLCLDVLTKLSIVNIAMMMTILLPTVLLFVAHAIRAFGLRNGRNDDRSVTIMTRSFFAGQSGRAQQQPPQDRFSITLLDLAVLVPIRYTTFVRQMYVRSCGQKKIQFGDSQITGRKQQE